MAGVSLRLRSGASGSAKARHILHVQHIPGPLILPPTYGDVFRGCRIASRMTVSACNSCQQLWACRWAARGRSRLVSQRSGRTVQEARRSTDFVRRVLRHPHSDLPFAVAAVNQPPAPAADWGRELRCTVRAHAVCQISSESACGKAGMQRQRTSSTVTGWRRTPVAVLHRAEPPASATPRMHALYVYGRLITTS
jgi:hypothetical protein